MASSSGEIIDILDDDTVGGNNGTSSLPIMTTPPSTKKRLHDSHSAPVTVSQSKEKKQRRGDRKNVLGVSNSNDDNNTITNSNTSNMSGSASIAEVSLLSSSSSSKENHTQIVSPNITTAATANKQRFRFEKRATATASRAKLPPLLSDRLSSKNARGRTVANEATTPRIHKKSSPPKLFDLSSSKIHQQELPTKEKRALYLTKDIDNDADRNLQNLLWSIGCRYSLMSYQFAGVRGVTGVEKDYPQQQIKNSGSAITDWNQILRATEYKDGNHGLLLADSMGLGKTVQAVCATMLRNAIADAQGKPPLPTVLVSPNHAVGMQWAETLVKAGVDAGRIFQFTPKRKHEYSGAIYILLTRYELQSEMKYLLNLAKPPPRGNNHHRQPAAPLVYSPLFPHAPNQLLLKLLNQYESQQRARVKNRYRNPKETAPACVTRLLRDSSSKLQTAAFRSVIIDEAHFLKNPLAFWGLGASLLGLHGERTVPMSGTPMNNGPQDMATLMTFMNPKMEEAHEEWWKDATSFRASTDARVRENIAARLEKCMLRRSKKLLEDRLPKKTVVLKDVAPMPLELHVYEQYEEKFMLALDKFKQLSIENAAASPETIRKRKELFEIMMALSSCMRMSLIHPALPGGGRDWTINFSPSRRGLSEKLCDENRCVICNAIDKKKRAEKKKQKSHGDQTVADALENLQDDQLQGDDDIFDDIIEDDDKTNVSMDEIVDKGEIIEISREHCWLPNIRNGGLRHYAHEKCLEMMEACSSSLSAGSPACPLCADLRNRARLQSGKIALLEKKKEAEMKGMPIKPESNVKTNLLENLEVDRPVYCQDVVPGLEEGFKVTAKLDSILSDLKTNTKTGDKIILLSFFKGSLDLLEGAIVHDLGIDCARFDGDNPPETRQVELNRFKQDPNCKVLLMTVQTGGTGLNIVEANRCEFIDRWFNPFVHDQAEDRLHRLGQKRPITVTYHDTNYTVDIAMRRINEIKTRNAEILLADGSSLTMASAGLSYKEMAGELGNTVRAVRMARIQGVLDNPDATRLMHQQTAASIFEQLEQGSNTSGIHRRSPFNTIGDALAHLLGFVPNVDTKPAPASSSNELETKAVKSEKQLSKDSSSSNSDEDLMASKAVFLSPKEEITEPAHVVSLLDNSDSSDDEDFTGAPTFTKKER